MSNEIELSNLLDQIEQNRSKIRSLRAEERSVNEQEKLFLSEPLIKRNGLRENLKSCLPKELVPSNIGELEQVVWNFEIPMTLSFVNGSDSIILGNGKIYELIEQIGQESCFILTGISRVFESQGIAGNGLPVKFLIRDRQSTRQIMDKPISLAHVPHSGKVLKLATPYLFMPNARVAVEISSMLNSDLTITGAQASVELILSGVRCRISDVSRIVEAMYL
jgi:hypothetical protein